jgi:hypothetical protein
LEIPLFFSGFSSLSMVAEEISLVEEAGLLILLFTRLGTVLSILFFRMSMLFSFSRAFLLFIDLVAEIWRGYPRLARFGWTVGLRLLF